MSKKLSVIAGTVAVGAIAALATIITVNTVNEIESKKEKEKNDNYNKNNINDPNLVYDPSQIATVSLLGHHNKFISCPSMQSNNVIVKCNKNTISNNEIFISIPIPNDNINDETIKIALKTWDGRYLSVQKNGTIHCDRTDIGNWEIFIVEKHLNKWSNKELYSLKSYHAKFLCAEFFGNLVGNRDKCSKWEKFDIKIVNWDDDDWGN